MDSVWSSDTGSQRPATGLDINARQLLINLFSSEFTPDSLFQIFISTLYATYDDYFQALKAVWGQKAYQTVYEAAEEINSLHQDPNSYYYYQDGLPSLNEVILHYMPESDFRLAIFKASLQSDIDYTTDINQICINRGIPWVFVQGQGFQWNGDKETEVLALRPARSAIEDSRLEGAKSEFDLAQAGVSTGTPDTLKHSVCDSASAVESTMKVLLEQRGIQYDTTLTAQPMFKLLVTEKIVPHYMEKTILAASTPRNKIGGHGAGSSPHDVSQEVAETVLASAAIAIAYLYKLLP